MSGIASDNFEFWIPYHSYVAFLETLISLSQKKQRMSWEGETMLLMFSVHLIPFYIAAGVVFL